MDHLDLLNAETDRFIAAVRPDAFGPEFSPEAFVDYVFASLLMLLTRGERSCGVLLELIRRALY